MRRVSKYRGIIEPEGWIRSAAIQRPELPVETWTPGQQVALLSLHSDKRSRTVVEWLRARSTCVVTKADYDFLIAQGVAERPKGRFAVISMHGMRDAANLATHLIASLGIHAFWYDEGWSQRYTRCVCGWIGHHDKKSFSASTHYRSEANHLDMVAKGKWPPKDPFPEIERKIREDYERKMAGRPKEG